MDWKCPGCGLTFKRINQAHQCVSGGGPELAFTGSKAKWLPLYMELLVAARARMQFDCVYPPSGGVIWRKRSAFAAMNPESRCLRVNFRSNQPLRHIEGVAVFPMSANRVLHVVSLQNNARVVEIVEYIQSSYVLTNQEGK